MTLPPELIVFFTAFTPFLDIKLAIPIGLKLGLSLTSTTFFAAAGSLIPAAIALALIEPVSNFLRKRSKKIDHFFHNLFDKTRKTHSERFNRYGGIFLILFVASPLPGSGPMGGAIVAFLFGINYFKAISLIFIGLLITAIAITAGFGSLFSLIDYFFN